MSQLLQKMDRRESEIRTSRVSKNGRDRQGTRTLLRNVKQTEPRALTKLGLDPNHWTSKVKGIGKSYWRLVAEVEDLIELAAQWQQRTVYGVGFARRLINR